MTLPPPSRQQPSLKQDLFFVVQLAWNLGFIIAIPAVVFGLAGASLDKWLHTSPGFLLLGMGCALALSLIGVSKRIGQILSRRS